MGLALVCSVAFILVAVVAACWANGLLNGLFFVLTESGWKTEADQRTLLHPIAHKISLGFRYLTVLPPVIALFWGIGRRSWQKFKASNLLTDHYIVCGVGWQGRAYLRSLKDRRMASVAIELAADEMAAQFCQKQSALLIYGNADEKPVLISAGVARAKEVFVCTGSQDDNLSIAQSIGKVMQNMPKRESPLQVSVSLADELIDGTHTDQIFAPLLQYGPNCHFVLYDPDRRMARCFFYQHKVYQWADEMNKLAQWKSSNRVVPNSTPALNAATVKENPGYRVHMVFLGYSRLVSELILQYARIWPAIDQKAPLFSVVCKQTDRVESFLSRHPGLSVKHTEEPQGEKETENAFKPGSVKIYNLAEYGGLIDLKLMSLVEQSDPVTAVICSADDMETSLQYASYCRLLSNSSGLWEVPIFADLERREGTEGLLEVSATLPFSRQRIVPFGSALQYCDTELLAYMDELAQAIHKNYVEENEVKDEHGNPLPAFRKWAQLDQRYQRSNYRAADQALLKLYSAGNRWAAKTPLISGTNRCTPQKLLAELEHQSWVNEKILDGWSQGDRDELRKRHPNLVTWDNLSDKTKEKDTNQVITVFEKQFCSELPSAGQRLGIGFIGHTNITTAQVHTCRQQLSAKLETLHREARNCWLDLISPLAPGSDILLVQETVKTLLSGQYPVVGFRLVIPVAVPWNKVDEDFRPHWEKNNQCLFNHPVDPQSEDQWEAFKYEVQRARDDLYGSITAAGYSVEAIDLKSEPGEKIDNHNGYIRAAQWIVDYSDVLIAVLDEKRTSTVSDEWTDGGTGHTVAQWESINKGRLMRIDPIM